MALQKKHNLEVSGIFYANTARGVFGPSLPIFPYIVFGPTLDISVMLLRCHLWVRAGNY